MYYMYYSVLQNNYAKHKNSAERKKIMTDKKESTKSTKSTSFRITPENTDKLKEIWKHVGGTQDNLMKELILAYELQNASNVLIDRKAEIDTFRENANKLVSTFIRSLEYNAECEDHASQKVRHLIQSKDQTIMELQETIRILEADSLKQSELMNKVIEEKAKIEKELEFVKNQLSLQQQYLEAFKVMKQENDSLKTKTSVD